MLRFVSRLSNKVLFRSIDLFSSSFFFQSSVVPLRNPEDLHHKSTDDYVNRYVNDPII